MAPYTDAVDVDYGSLTPAQSMRIVSPAQTWDDSFALKVACEDFHAAENYRTQNHDWRWQNADALYLGYVPQKYWEGTKIPRANISVFTAYEQIEAMIPRIMQALFGDNPWFEAIPLSKTTPEAARKARDIIMSQMNDARVRKIIEIAIRSGLIYGNGIVEAQWLYSSKMVKKFIPKFIPRKQRAFHPLLGWTTIPVGGFDRIIREVSEEEYENRPTLENIPLKDFYIDPNCPTPDPNDARFTVSRSYQSIDYLKDLRGTDGFDIPDDGYLIQMAQNKPSANGDNAKSWQESARMGMWSPQIDQTLDPGGTRIELLRYKTDRRVVWVVNRSLVIYNAPNPYGKKLQYNFSYTDLVDRFYGLAMTDVTEGEQRLQEGIINARVDELALNIHPATVVSRSNREPIYKLRVRPGGVNYSDDPKNDLVRQYTNNVTAQAFNEIAASDMRVQKITGMNDLVSGGQNPVARSATGAGLQGQATFARSQYQVEKVEYNVLEPLLGDFHMLNNHHLDPNQRIQALEGESIDPLAIFGAEVKFEMRAGSRMAARSGLAQQIPYILQEMMNPQLQQQLSMQGKTVDHDAVLQMLLDATGLKAKATWVRPMTQQEQAALKQAQENPVNAELIKQRERMQAMGQLQQQKGEIGLTDTAIKSKVALVIADKKAEEKKIGKPSD